MTGGRGATTRVAPTAWSLFAGREGLEALGVAGGVVGASGAGGGGVGRAEGDAREEGGVCGGDVAPVETERLESGRVGHVPPLAQSGIVGEDAVIAAVETPYQHVRWRILGVQRDRRKHPHREGVPGVHDGPRDGVHQRAVGGDPATHDLASAFAPHDRIGLPQLGVAHEPAGDDALAVAADPADADRDLDAWLIVAPEHQLTAGQLDGRGGGGGADERGVRWDGRWSRCPARGATIVVRRL